MRHGSVDPKDRLPLRRALGGAFSITFLDIIGHFAPTRNAIEQAAACMPALTLQCVCSILGPMEILWQYNAQPTRIICYINPRFSGIVRLNAVTGREIRQARPAASPTGGRKSRKKAKFVAVGELAFTSCCVDEEALFDGEPGVFRES